VIRYRFALPSVLLFGWLLTTWPAPRAHAEGGADWAGGTAAELTRQGREHAKNGDEALAIRRFADAVRLDPTYAPAYLELGAARERTGDWMEAERTYAVAIEHVPAFVAAFRARAALLRRMGKPAAAIADLETVARLAEGPESLRDLAERYAEDQAWPAALASWRKLLAIAEKTTDERLAHEAAVHIRALVVLCGELDPVTDGATRRDWVRRAEASVAKRRGM
jgi:tetratricopeptide (TPR) repeat protein